MKRTREYTDMSKVRRPARISIPPVAAAVFLLAAPAPAAEAPMEVFAVSDAVRIFEDGAGCPDARPAEIRAAGLRNETISAQCVIRAREDLNDVTVSVGALKKTDTGDALPGDCLRWNFVDGIFIATNTPKFRKADLLRPAPAWFPDCLGEAERCAVKKDGFKSVYLTLAIPRDAAAGEYRADVTATAGGASVSLPLWLTVHPLTLPDERHLMVAVWFSTSGFKEHHGVDPSDPEAFDRMLGLYARNMAGHWQNVFRADMNLVRTTRAADGSYRHDFTEFDRRAQIFWDTGRMDRLETGFVADFGPERWASREIRLSRFRVKNESDGRTEPVPGEEFLPRFLPAFVEHLREKQWLGKTLFHICDEPSDHNVMTWREASDFVHRHAPELRRLDAIETPHCLDRLEVWCPKLDHLATWPDAYENARRAGNELWFYTVGIYQSGSLPNKTVDVPLIDARLLHWLNYRLGAKGYLHWGFNAWTPDPWKAPGLHRCDGWHVYPKKDGLLDSLRWEQMRNGIQDYECLRLLEDGIGRIRATLDPRVRDLIEPSRRGIEIASRVVRSPTDVSRDSAELQAARQQAIEEILALDAPPRLVVQTDPPEHSTVANDAQIDVHGWAEPGTRLRINDQPAPLASDGLLLQESRVSKDGAIVVEAENDRGRKTIVRRFRLQFPPDPPAP